jgi:hypothetical protein
MTDPNLRLMQRSVNALLDELSETHDKEFDWAIHVPDVAKFIRKAITDEQELGDAVLTDVARKLTRAYVEAKAPPVPKEPGQLALFYDAKALCSLGGREVCRMEIMQAQHTERWRTVLTVNFQAQANAYFGHVAYIDDRLPRQRAGDLTLGEVEKALGSEGGSEGGDDASPTD